MFVRGEQVVARWNLENAVIQGSDLMPPEFDGMGHGFGIPTPGHSRGKQRLYLGRQIQSLAVQGVEQRLNAESIASGENRPVPFVPNHKGKLAAQPMQALGAEILIEVECDLAVRPGAQAVARPFELMPDRFISVKFTIDDD